MLTVVWWPVKMAMRKLFRGRATLWPPRTKRTTCHDKWHVLGRKLGGLIFFSFAGNIFFSWSLQERHWSACALKAQINSVKYKLCGHQRFIEVKKASTWVGIELRSPTFGCLYVTQSCWTFCYHTVYHSAAVLALFFVSKREGTSY